MLEDYVENFVKDALRHAADTYNTPPSPLLADAYHAQTKKHLRRDYGKQRECKDVVYSNLARQMNFMRVLHALYVLNGNAAYKRVFEDNYKYYVDHYQHKNGLFAWGGHRMVDLKNLLTTGEMTHELKNDYPAYPLMLEINREATLKYMRAFWNAHVFNWETLEISRHGEYDKKPGKLWDNDFGDPPPFIEVKGLSFRNTGSDLVYAACEYYKAAGEPKALLWARRLEHMYFKSRDKYTGLGVYQFNQPKARNFSDDYTISTSDYGDRAKRQMGPELGEGCLEGNVLAANKTDKIYGYSMLVLMHQARTLLDKENRPLTEAQRIQREGAAAEFLENCRLGLEAYAKHAYIPETNMFRPMLANGRDLTGFELQRDGYYGKKGRVFRHYSIEGPQYLAFAKAAAMTGSKPLAAITEQLTEKTANAGDCPYRLFAFLNLHSLSNNEKHLLAAETIAQNIAAKPHTEYIHLNSLDPLAVVCCIAARRGKLNQIDASVYI